MVKKAPCFVAILLALCLVGSSIALFVVPRPRVLYAQSITSSSQTPSPEEVCANWDKFITHHPELKRVSCSDILVVTIGGLAKAGFKGVKKFLSSEEGQQFFRNAGKRLP